MTSKNFVKKSLPIGDTLRFVLEQEEGDFLDVISVTSSIKPAEAFGVVPEPSVDATFDLTVVADEPNQIWNIDLSDEDSATLTEGWYAVDVRIETNLGVDHTDIVFVNVENSVT